MEPSDLTKENYLALRQMYRNAERLMKMRIQAGNALCAYFYRQMLGVNSGDTIYPRLPEPGDEDLNNEIDIKSIEDFIDDSNPSTSDENPTQYALILKRLERDWRDIWKVAVQVTGQIQDDDQNQLILDARNPKKKDTSAQVKVRKTKRTPPKNDTIARLTTHTESQDRLSVTKKNFDNYRSGIIQKYKDYLMVDNYMNLVALEAKQMKDITDILDDIPIHHKLSEIKGIGPKMTAFIISEIDIFKIVYASEIIAYAGLDADSKNRGKSTKHACDGCFRFYLEFETDKVKENMHIGQFQSYYRHRNAYYTDNVSIIAGGVDDHKKKRIYLGRLDNIPGLPNDISASSDERVGKDMLTKLITFEKDTRLMYDELIHKNGVDVKTVDNTKNPSNYHQIIIKGEPTGIYVNNLDNPKLKYSISCQRSLTYNKDVQSKFIGTLAGCLMKSGVTKDANGNKVRGKYPSIYDEKKFGILNRPITFEELGKFSKFKNGKKERTTGKTLLELKAMVGENGSYYDLPVEIRGKLESDAGIGKERNGKAHSNAIRRMLCQFIIHEIYRPWRKLEGLPVHNDYAEGKLGIIHKNPN